MAKAGKKVSFIKLNLSGLAKRQAEEKRFPRDPRL